MKRYLSAVLAITLLCGLSACGGGVQQTASSTEKSTPSPSKTANPVPDVAGKPWDVAFTALVTNGFNVVVIGKDGKKWVTGIPNHTVTVVSLKPSAGQLSDSGDVEATVNMTEAEFADARKADDKAAADKAAADKAAAGKAAADAAAAAKAAADKAAADAAAAAKAAADKAAADAAAAGTVSQQNALRKAAQYLNYSAFSRTGLINQLEYEKYSTEDATWAVDRVTVDWNVEAAQKAKDYLKYTSFSRSGLVDQLLYEGYTPEQAEYGVSQTGL
ncbi:Ltp family lipoprotein [Arthrobacter sp. YA7-1]|uniref:Ltp family lipoprotein n=1 Tax=Arthrobacter sp. YA7-1 TaxID=2987701 RepID=UPI002227BFDE|nr:Ltp family lipoprotein [Arthrobacter sp. YA7-1]UYY80396.1 Ltp family lipoprotein [Arthrobacter sp. YA7-1]